MKTRTKRTKTTKITTITLLILSAMLLSLTGCKGGFFKGGGGDGIESYPFRSGTQGLSMKFIEGMPPDQLYIGTDFSTGVKMKNMGAYDVEGDAMLEINVPDPSAFLFREGNTKTITLRGKSLYIKEGEEAVMTFPMKALCFPGYTGTRDSIVTNYSRKIKAQACYYYETTANADVCIDTRKYLRTGKERPECEMQDVRLSGGQGGPVGVARISPTIIPKSETEYTVQLNIAVDKLQGVDHTIYAPDNNGCQLDPNNNRQNMVSLEVEMGGQMLDCNPSELQLKENKAVNTICRVQANPQLGAFISPITVNMKYYVQQMILRQIVVEPPPGVNINCAALRGEQIP